MGKQLRHVVTLEACEAAQIQPSRRDANIFSLPRRPSTTCLNSTGSPSRSGLSSYGLTVKTHCIRQIREPISSVLLRGSNSFQKVSRHQDEPRTHVYHP
jgi:hypothetical protein